VSDKHPYIYSTRVRFSHTDPAGYVFFPRFFEEFQAAVEDWFRCELEIDYAGLVLKRGVGFPTAHIECDFVKPCHLGEMLDLTLSLTKVGTSSVTLEFIGSVAGQLRLCAKSVLVFVDLKKEKTVVIPNLMRDKFEAYQARC
jgi:4-hydroxybenzoyl-CoA thioesterase